MIIRKAAYADAIAMSQIRNEAARTGVALWTSHQILPGDAPAWLKPALERGTAVVAVDEHDQVLGYATAEQWRAYEAYEHSVENSIYIRASARGQGLGKQLLAALLAASKAVGDKLMMAFLSLETLLPLSCIHKLVLSSNALSRALVPNLVKIWT